MNYGKAGWAFN